MNILSLLSLANFFKEPEPDGGPVDINKLSREILRRCYKDLLHKSYPGAPVEPHQADEVSQSAAWIAAQDYKDCPPEVVVKEGARLFRSWINEQNTSNRLFTNSRLGFDEELKSFDEEAIAQDLMNVLLEIFMRWGPHGLVWYVMPLVLEESPTRLVKEPSKLRQIHRLIKRIKRDIKDVVLS